MARTKLITLTLALTGSLLIMGSSLQAGGDFGQASDLFNVGVGARAMAMGSAFTALSDDASAPYYNPAGLAFLDEHQLMAMYAPLFLDTNFNFLSSAHPFGDKWGSLALADALLNSSGFELRDDFNNVTDADGALHNNAIFASYAHKLPLKAAFGVNAKFIQQKVAGNSDGALGLDAGLLYRPTPLFRFGASFTNFNSPSVTLKSSEDVFRPVAKLGLASEVFKQKLILSVDRIKLDQQGSLFAAGVEYKLNKLLHLRGGYNANHRYTFGIGVNIKPFRVDYAFSDSDVGSFNKVSLTWAWHNIYQTDVTPPLKEGKAVYPLGGFTNNVAFKTTVPGHVVSRWSLLITDSDGKGVRDLGGDLRPPAEINWDAKNNVGEPVVDGTYFYAFRVKYKNGKTWIVKGNLKLKLPDRKTEEPVDMNLDLNGAKATEAEFNAYQ